MHPQFDIPVGPARDRQVFDPVTQLIRIRDIVPCYTADALHVHMVVLQRNPERDGTENGQFVRRVDAVDIECRIGLRIAEALRLRQHVGEFPVVIAHLGKNEVAGAVHDPREPADMVARKPLADRFDDRDPARDRGLEGHHDTLALCGRKDLVAIQRNQGLVSRDNVFAVLDRPHDQLECGLLATDQFDDDLHIRIVHDGPRILRETDILGRQSLETRAVADRGVTDDDSAPRAARDLVGIALQYGQCAAADGTEAQKADFHGIHESLS